MTGLGLCVLFYVFYVCVHTYRDIAAEQPGTAQAVNLVGTAGSTMSASAGRIQKAVTGNYEAGDRDDNNEFVWRMTMSLYEFGSIIVMKYGSDTLQEPLATVLAPIYAFVPRDVFPDKPVYLGSGDHAREMGHAYGGASVTLVGSIYWAFGPVGVGLVMGFLGGLLGCLRVASSQGAVARYLWLGIEVFAVLRLAYAGEDIQSVLTNVTRVATMLAALWFIEKHVVWPSPLGHLNILKAALGPRRGRR